MGGGVGDAALNLFKSQQAFFSLSSIFGGVNCNRSLDLRRDGQVVKVRAADKPFELVEGGDVLVSAFFSFSLNEEKKPQPVFTLAV